MLNVQHGHPACQIRGGETIPAQILLQPAGLLNVGVEILLYQV